MPAPRIPNLRDALDLVRGHPAEVEALDKAAADAAAEAVRAEKERARLAAKVDAKVAERTEHLIRDWAELQSEAVRVAAEGLARHQLEREVGLVPPRAAAMSGLSPRLTAGLVERALHGLVASAPIAWRGGRPAADVRSADTRKAAEAARADAAPRERTAYPVSGGPLATPDRRQASLEERKAAALDAAGGKRT